MTKTLEKNSIKPDFIICGVQKCGTTSLLKYLSQHRQITFSPPDTEIHFFDNPVNYKKGISEFSKHFKTKKLNGLIGQSTSSYIYDYVPERMFEYVPDAKLIFILRNPVNRAYSHYWHAFSKNRESSSFEQALEKESDRIALDYFHLINFSYFNTGLYMKMLHSFLNYFKKNQMYCVILEELKTNPLDELNKIFKFLQLPFIESLKTEKAYNQTKIANFKITNKLLNNKLTRNHKLLYPFYQFHNRYLSRPYPQMNYLTKNNLNRKYLSEIEELEKFLNKDLSIWKK